MLPCRGLRPCDPSVELIGEIQEAEAELSRLESEHEQARRRLTDLRAQLAAEAGPRRPLVQPSPTSAALTPRTPEEKVGLFRRLFRGRTDVFPTRFESRRTGKPGYAPACANKFVRRVCELPKVRCGECPNQAFLPVDDAAVLAHLQGRHVMGVYPLLENETCWFLAVDFDKSCWREDVGAFVATCRDSGLPAAVERSRSGNGAHVWFFSQEKPSAAAPSSAYARPRRAMRRTPNPGPGRPRDGHACLASRNRSPSGFTRYSHSACSSRRPTCHRRW